MYRSCLSGVLTTSVGGAGGGLCRAQGLVKAAGGSLCRAQELVKGAWHNGEADTHFRQSSVVSVGSGKAECLSPVEGEGVAMPTSAATLQ